MPRDSSGTYSLPPGTLVETGETILVSQHNPAMQDLGQAITNSLDRDGNGAMRASLAMGGNKITGLADGVNPTDAATVGQIGGSSTIPIGSTIEYWGATPPDGYLFAAGQAISRSTYAALFAILGTTFGSGDGSTTFNLPDCRGRVSAGRDDMNGSAAGRLTSGGSGVNGVLLGATGGAQTVTLTTAEMPSHSHTVTDPGHSHTALERSFAGASGGLTGAEDGGTTGSATTGITLSNTGGGGAHNNVQPTIICNKIIKVS